MDTYSRIVRDMKTIAKEINSVENLARNDTPILGKLKDLLKRMVGLVYKKFSKPYPKGKCLRQAICGLKHIGIESKIINTVLNVLDLLYAHKPNKAYSMMKVWFYDVTVILN